MTVTASTEGIQKQQPVDWADLETAKLLKTGVFLSVPISEPLGTTLKDEG